MESVHRPWRWRLGVVVVGGWAVAACGGGGGGTANPVATGAAPAVAIQAVEIPVAPVLADALVNGSFETPRVAAGELRILPGDVPGWTFTGTAALSAVDSRFSVGVGASGEGTQMVALQNDSTIVQTVQIRPGDELRFRAVQRQNYSTGDQVLAVFVDGVQQGESITPVRGDGWRLHRVSLALAGMSAGQHVLEIRGMTSGTGEDRAALVDAVQLVPGSTQWSVGAVVNAGFEAPTLSAGSFAYRPEGITGWTMVGAAAVSSNDSQFTAQAPTAVDGTQVAVLQMNASLSQTLGLLPGDRLVFQTTPRLNFGLGVPQVVGVYVDGHKQMLLSDLASVSGRWVTVTAPLTSVLEAGRYSVEIRSEVAPPYNDAAVFIDQVSVQRPTY